MEKILIFGTGSVAEVLFGELNDAVEVLAFIHSDENVTEFHGYPVIRPRDISGYAYSKVIIASGYYFAMEKILLEHGVPQEKIAGFIFDESEFYLKTAGEMDRFFNDSFHRDYMKKILRSDRLLPVLYPCCVWKNNAFPKIRKDFVREQTTAYLAQELKRKNVEGAIAELGVFQGDFTVVMNDAFPDRVIYLFDTFCGFASADVLEDENTSNKQNELRKFKDTSVEHVLSRLRDDAQCVVKKGYFPDTFDLHTEKFAFVSVDLNMKNAVMSALELIWPRISPGGYMLISDYNAPFYEGTREAVQAFCDERGIAIVALPDLYGSALLCKNGDAL